MPKGPQGQKRNLTLSALAGAAILLWIGLGQLIGFWLPPGHARVAVVAGLALVLITIFAMAYLALSSGNSDA